MIVANETELIDCSTGLNILKAALPHVAPKDGGQTGEQQRLVTVEHLAGEVGLTKIKCIYILRAHDMRIPNGNALVEYKRALEILKSTLTQRRAAPATEHSDVPSVDRRPSVWRAVVNEPSKVQRFLPLSMGETTVGRAEGCDIRLDVVSVSRRHALLVVKQDHIWVRDLGSTGGTFVNGDQVRHVLVGPPDHIQIGECELRIERAMCKVCNSPMGPGTTHCWGECLELERRVREAARAVYSETLSFPKDEIRTDRHVHAAVAEAPTSVTSMHTRIVGEMLAQWEVSHAGVAMEVGRALRSMVESSEMAGPNAAFRRFEAAEKAAQALEGILKDRLERTPEGTRERWKEQLHRRGIGPHAFGPGALAAFLLDGRRPSLAVMGSWLRNVGSDDQAALLPDSIVEEVSEVIIGNAHVSALDAFEVHALGELRNAYAHRSDIVRGRQKLSTLVQQFVKVGPTPGELDVPDLCLSEILYFVREVSSKVRGGHR
jgi:hypothetical protein